MNKIPEKEIDENPEYLTSQILTYIGNKRSLLNEIGVAVEYIKKRLGKERLHILDAFSGSGIVSRFFKRHASRLTAIDLEPYAAAVARCYLRNKTSVDMNEVENIIARLNETVDSSDFPPGFIEEMYSPRSEDCITREDRVFYTKKNARRIDNYRRMLEFVPEVYKDLILGPLLSEASIHANTSGIFKGFHKNRHTKTGQFGGTNRDSLARIMGEIRLSPPVLSRFDCETEVFQGDANIISPTIQGLDVAYLDPPYNQHPYGSNYFMLNLIVEYKAPEKVSKISGIPENWNRSKYNSRIHSKSSFRELINGLDSRFILVSFNNEGFISREEMFSMLRQIGSVQIVDIRYNTFRGCRNIRNRSIHVKEQLFIAERK